MWCDLSNAARSRTHHRRNGHFGRAEGGRHYRRQRSHLILGMNRERAMTTTFNAAATKTVRVNGTSFVYREIGDKSDIPVVFLHHLTAVLEDWDPAIAADRSHPDACATVGKYQLTRRSRRPRACALDQRLGEGLRRPAGPLTMAVQTRAASRAGPELGASQREPGLQKPEHRNHATITASFAQRPARELGTLLANQQQV
jgi:hypothetical protein